MYSGARALREPARNCPTYAPAARRDVYWNESEGVVFSHVGGQQSRRDAAAVKAGHADRLRREVNTPQRTGDAERFLPYFRTENAGAQSTTALAPNESSSPTSNANHPFPGAGQADMLIEAKARRHSDAIRQASSSEHSAAGTSALARQGHPRRVADRRLKVNHSVDSDQDDKTKVQRFQVPQVPRERFGGGQVLSATETLGTAQNDALERLDLEPLELYI